MHPRHAGEHIALQPGLTATAEIVTGRSTVMRYLTKPVIKASQESMGER